MHLNSRRLFAKHARPYFQSGMRVLEIGPDRHPSTYQVIVADDSVVWHTLGITASPNYTYVAPGEYEFPVEENSYDLVLSGQVIEHVRMPWRWMQEIARVTRPGGHVVTVNPMNWGFHRSPVDCWRIFPDGMSALYEDAGLETVLAICDSLETWGDRLNGAGLRWVIKHLKRRPYPLKGAPFFAEDTLSIARKPIAPPEVP